MKIFRLIAAGLLIPLALPDMSRLDAQEENRSSENTMDLWSRWRNGFEKFEAAENAAELRNFPEALKLYTESRDAFESVRTLNPEWQKSVINYRIDLCSRKIESLKQFAGKNRTEAKRLPPKTDKQARTAGQIARQKAQLEAAGEEIASLRKKVQENANASARIAELTKEKNDLLKKQASLQVLLKDAKAELAKKKPDPAAEKLALAEKKRADDLASKLSALEQTRRKELALLADARAGRLKAEGDLRKANEDLTKTTAAALRTAELEKVNGKLTADNTTLKNDREKLAGMSDQLSKELQTLRQRIALLEKQQKEAGKKLVPAEKLKDLEAKIAKLTAEKNTLVKNSSASSAEIQTLQKKILVLNQEKSVLAGTNITSEKEIRKLQEQIVSLRNKCGKYEKTAASGAENIRKLEENIAALKKEIAAFRAKPQVDIAALQKQIADLRKTNQILEKNCTLLAQVTRTNESLKKQLADAQKRADEFAKAQAKDSSLAKENRQLLVSLKKEQEKTAVLEKQIRSSGKIVPDQRENAALRQKRAAEMQALSAKLAEAGKKIGALKAELAQEKEKNKDFIQANAILEKRAEENDELKQELVSCRLDLAQAKKVIDEAAGKLLDDKKISEAQKEAVLKAGKRIRELEGKLSSIEKNSALKAQADKSFSAQASAEAAKLRKEILLLQKKIQENAEAAAENARLQQAMSALKNTLQSREKELAALKKSTAGKTSAEDPAAKKMREDLVRQYEMEIAHLKKEIEALRAKSPDKKLRAEIAAQTAAVSELKEARAQYESALKNMTSKNAALQKKIKELEIALSNSKIETDAARKALRKGPPQGELERKNNELQEKAAKYEVLHQKTLAQLAEEKRKNSQLSKDLADARRKGEASAVAAGRLGTELKAWQSGKGDSPELKAKDEALSAALKERADAKEELRNRTMELSMANEQIKEAHKTIRSLKKKLSASNELVKELKMLNPEKALALEYRRRNAGRELVNKSPVQPKKIQTPAKAAPVKTAPAKAEKAKTLKAVPVTDKSAAKKYSEAMKSALDAEKGGNYADALMDFWRAAELRPESAEAYAGISRAYLARKEKKSAVSAYRRAVELGLARDRDFEKKLNQ